MVEQLPFKEMVAGSIPAGRTKTQKFRLRGIFCTLSEPLYKGISNANAPAPESKSENEIARHNI